MGSGCHSSASCGLVKGKKKKKKKEEEDEKTKKKKKWIEEEQRYVTKEYKLRRWKSQLFNVGGLWNWKMSKGTFLKCGFFVYNYQKY